MFKEEEEHYFIEEFRKIGIEAIYGNKNHKIEQIKAIAKEKKIVHGIQTHSSNIVLVDKNIDLLEVPFKDCDGMISSRKDVLLYTKHADCLALFFYDKKNGVIGICHSGWKGSFNEISKNLISKMKLEFNSNLEDIMVGVGIGISKKNYEVDIEFYRMFEEKFLENLEKDSSSLKNIIEESFELKDGKIYFDNELFNFYLLKSYGIKEENIILSNFCTYENENFNSYRKNRANKGRNLAYIYIK